MIKNIKKIRIIFINLLVIRTTNMSFKLGNKAFRTIVDCSFVTHPQMLIFQCAGLRKSTPVYILVKCNHPLPKTHNNIDRFDIDDNNVFMKELSACAVYHRTGGNLSETVLPMFIIRVFVVKMCMNFPKWKRHLFTVIESEKVNGS